MSDLGSLGIGRPLLWRQPPGDVEHVIVHRPLDRILAFTGYSIDDVVDDPIAKNAVLGYYKLHKQIIRRGEILELERMWNSP
jgi:hypothetical protein